MAPAISRAITGCCSTPRPTCAAALRVMSLASPYAPRALQATSRAAPSTRVLASPRNSPAALCALPAAWRTAAPAWFSSIVVLLLRLGRPRGRQRPASERPATDQGVVEDQHDNRANHGHEHAVEIGAGDAGAAEAREQEASDDG